MRLTATADVPGPPSRAYAELADLSGYRHWLSIVLDVAPAPAHEDDPGPAWFVDLGARVGPIRRSKRVRMVRTVADEPSRLRFERLEHDGRPHGTWVLDATVDPQDGDEASVVTVDLAHRGTSLPFLEPLLREEARRAGRRLAARIGAATGG